MLPIIPGHSDLDWKDAEAKKKVIQSETAIEENEGKAEHHLVNTKENMLAKMRLAG